MTDLEKHVFRRDGGFVLKLAVALLLWIAAGCAGFAYLDSSRIGDWGAGFFQSLAGDQALP